MKAAALLALGLGTTLAPGDSFGYIKAFSKRMIRSPSTFARGFGNEYLDAMSVHSINATAADDFSSGYDLPQESNVSGNTVSAHNVDALEACIRASYNEWLDRYGKVADKTRYPIFRTNWIIQEEYGQRTGKYYIMNEYADWTEDEYVAMVRRQEDLLRQQQLLELKNSKVASSDVWQQQDLLLQHKQLENEETPVSASQAYAAALAEAAASSWLKLPEETNAADNLSTSSSTTPSPANTKGPDKAHSLPASETDSKSNALSHVGSSSSKIPPLTLPKLPTPTASSSAGSSDYIYAFMSGPSSSVSSSSLAYRGPIVDTYSTDSTSPFTPIVGIFHFMKRIALFTYKLNQLMLLKSLNSLRRLRRLLRRA